MVVERVASSQEAAPILAFPASEQSFELFVEVAPGVAGCAICRRPIQQGMSRLRFRVRLQVPVEGRHFETKYAHAGCITDRVKPEVIRLGSDCWDCGAKEPSNFEFCFTVHRFAWGILCPKCQTKKRWDKCSSCNIYYPFHLVAPAAAPEPRPEPPDPLSVFAAMDEWVPNPGDRVCEYCVSKRGYLTEELAAEQERERQERRAQLRESFEERKRLIAQEGLLDAPADEG